MGFTNKGLINGGKTKHYSLEYDEALSAADGVTRANALLAKMENDFTLMQSWFGGISVGQSLPLNVKLKNASGGASWSGNSISLMPGSGASSAVCRYLLVSEVTEMFMNSQDRGWFQGGDEGSKGEGLSRFLGVQFQLANGLGPVAPAGFVITPGWINSIRKDFIDSAPDDNHPDVVNGCTTLFIHFLHSQLGFTINQIIAAASSTLAGVYQNLTGLHDAFSRFGNLVNLHYPKGFTYHPNGDNIFPVADLSAQFSPNQIVCGYDGTATLFLDKPALAEINVALKSDDPSLVIVPTSAQFPVGSMSIPVAIKTKAIAIPFAPKFVKVHASYANKTFDINVEVVPPTVASVHLSPSEVVCGNVSTGTVTLNRPSLLGPAVVNLISEAPGFATVQPTVTIPQNQASSTFPVATPDIEIPFATAHAQIFASYAGASASATLTVDPKVVAGILKSVTLIPTSVTGGNSAHGTVTLEAAVSTPTLVGLAALQSGAHLPIPGGESDVAAVPPSATIPVGAVSAPFTVTTKHVSAGVHKTAVIMAGAVVTRSAVLTVTG